MGIFGTTFNHGIHVKIIVTIVRILKVVSIAKRFDLHIFPWFKV